MNYYTHITCMGCYNQQYSICQMFTIVVVYLSLISSFALDKIILTYINLLKKNPDRLNIIMQLYQEHTHSFYHIGHLLF